ncbi:MAG: hypothetical protein ABFS42_06605 [Candidatus Krumholzibacteriota bacterium]
MMIAGGKLSFAMLLGVGAVLLSGCLFSPREPEPPGAGVQIDYLPQSKPANVWANLEKSLEAIHSPGWEDNISLDEFRYVPDDEAANQFPGIFDGWDRSREVTFINNFYNSGVSITARMVQAGFVFPPPVGNEMTIEDIIYDVLVINDSDASEVRYRGKCDVIFRLEANKWYIYEWRDLQGESDPDTGQLLNTMGVLRGTFGS